MAMRRKTKQRVKTAAIATGAVAFVAGAGIFLSSALQPTSPSIAAEVQKYNEQHATLAPVAPSSSAAAPTGTGMLGAIQKALQQGKGPLVISVLGDSTGNGPGEWVDLWARHLAKYGTVTLHQWDKDANDWEAKAATFPGGDRSITIWNASQPGTTYAYPLARLDLAQPAKPSFVILNFGHNIAAKPADTGSVELLAAVEAKWGKVPAAVTLQNPALGTRKKYTAGSVAALKTWTTTTGYPAIDVNAAYLKNGDLPSLMLDELHPNDKGSRIWADTVAATLG